MASDITTTVSGLFVCSPSHEKRDRLSVAYLARARDDPAECVSQALTRQIWIGAGIGITPFIALLKHMATERDGKRIDLIHAVPEIAPEPKALLEADVAAAGVDLYLIRDREDGLLTGERLREMLPDWSKASVWFCGPTAFGQALRKDLVAHGLRPADFHQELFNMR